MKEIVLNEKSRTDWTKISPFAEPEITPITFGDIVTGNHVVLDLPDRKEAVSVVGPKYNLISNRQAVDVGNEIMSQSGFDFSQVREIWTGRNFVQMYKTKQPLIELPKVNDVINLGLRIENSYDGSTKLRIAVMAFVLSCTNGMISDRQFGVFSIKHTGLDFDIPDALERLQTGAQNVIEMAPVFNTLTGETFYMDSLLEIAGNKNISPTFLGKWLKEMSEETTQPTAWDALQKGTFMLKEENKLAGIGTLEAWTEAFIDLGRKQLAA